MITVLSLAIFILYAYKRLRSLRSEHYESYNLF